VAAALWLVHPIQSEAVNYVSQRTELLVSFFYMMTLYCATRAWDVSTSNDDARRVPPGALYACAVIACALGMGSKEVMLTAPITIMLYDRAFLFESWGALWASRSRRWFCAALVATSGLSLVLIARGGRAETVGFGLGTPWYEYLYSQCWAIAHYLRLVVWPDALTYDYGSRPIHDLSGIPGAVGLTVLGVATVVAWRRPNRHWIAFLGSWFFLLLAPSSSVVPIQTEIAAERRVYLALAAVVVLVAVVIEWVRQRVRSHRVSIAGYAAGALLYGGLITATVARSRLYRTPQQLWRDAAITRPNNARALNGVAVAELSRDSSDLSEPDALLARALAVDSTFTQAWRNRAVIAIHANRFADAESLLRHGLQTAPRDSAINELLGTVLVAQGQPEQAVPYLRQVAAVFPSAKSVTELGTAYLTFGRLDSAIRVFRRATELDSTSVDAMSYLGAALVESGKGSEALPYLLRAVAKDSGTGFSLGLLCLAYGESHQADLAARTAALAVAREPKSVGVYLFAGRGLEAAGRLVGAEQYLAEAVRLSPDDPQALTRLGLVEASLGKTADATRRIQRALRIAPGYDRALRAMEFVRSR
jgi:tetratricopeptide (TPR) repeat protein